MSNYAHDYSRLPKWAQQEIERLRGNLSYTEHKLAEALEAQGLAGDNHTFVTYVVGDRRIRFTVGEAEYIEVYRSEYDHGSMVVRGSDSLAIQPKFSNVIEAKVTR